MELAHGANFLGITRNVLIYRMQKYRLGPYSNLPDGNEEETLESNKDISITISEIQIRRKKDFVQCIILSLKQFCLQ